ncbi:hypothetical protein HMSSN139_36680 [Paenibacillus sp. HMSSN-139]|nr:hypothetical protein HMSSN139_36680 [Paenibacillus sp. HMSSN-139]
MESNDDGTSKNAKDLPEGAHVLQKQRLSDLSCLRAGAQTGSGLPIAVIRAARRALEANGVTTLEKLAGLSEQEVLQFHGMGPSSIPKLREALHAKGFRFKS